MIKLLPALRSCCSCRRPIAPVKWKNKFLTPATAVRLNCFSTSLPRKELKFVKTIEEMEAAIHKWCGSSNTFRFV